MASEPNENIRKKLETETIGYLGKEFQLKLLYKILTDFDFGNNIITYLTPSYFDTSYSKKFVDVITKYYKSYGKVPSILDNTIDEEIRYRYKNNETDKDILLKLTEKIRRRYNKIQKGELPPSNEENVEKIIWIFIKQQEMKKFALSVINSITDYNIEDVDRVVFLENELKKIYDIGVEEDFGVEAMSNIEEVLKKDYRAPIPTGIGKLDEVMNNGLGVGEYAVIIAPLGVGKTTLLTKIANNAFECGKNVLQIIFEDTVKQVQRKHFAIWTGVKLSEMDIDDKNEEAKNTMLKLSQKDRNNYLVIKKFVQEGITINDIKVWINSFYKKHGFRFNLIILDYIDCVESHKNNKGDTLKDELDVIKAFEAMVDEYNVPGWTAIQGNRSSLTTELVSTDQIGGNIKRAQKSHFIMSIAKSSLQKIQKRANISILKSRIGKDGRDFFNVEFDNDSMHINIVDSAVETGGSARGGSDNPQETINNIDQMIQEGESSGVDVESDNITDEKVEKAVKEINEEGKKKIDNNDRRNPQESLNYIDSLK